MLGIVTIFDRLADDRGHWRRPCDIKAASKASGVDPFLLAPPHRRAGMFRIAAVTGVPYGIATTFFLAAQSLLMRGRVDVVLLAIMLPVMSLGFGVIFGYIMSARIWRSVADAREAMLEYDLCPHCTHPIAGIPPEPDGCTICPECGAAWRSSSSVAYLG